MPLSLLDQPLVVKLVQKPPRRFRTGQSVPDQFAHPILPQMAEVVQAFPTRRVQDHKALHLAGFIHAALPLLDRHVPFDAAR
ncbi:MAG TPA: hypothetical protein VGR73_20495 [Bryobacteraceae bacterium]|nr:hypothetical protein [Bryobacteraceae bacterium]